MSEAPPAAEQKESIAAKDLAEVLARELDNDGNRLDQLYDNPGLGGQLYLFEKRPNVIAAVAAVIKEQGAEKGEAIFRETLQLFSARLHQIFVRLSKGYTNNSNRPLQNAVREFAAGRLSVLKHFTNPGRAPDELIRAALAHTAETENSLAPAIKKVGEEVHTGANGAISAAAPA